jgi:hypothetical protein
MEVVGKKVLLRQPACLSRPPPLLPPMVASASMVAEPSSAVDLWRRCILDVTNQPPLLSLFLLELVLHIMKTWNFFPDKDGTSNTYTKESYVDAS